MRYICALLLLLAAPLAQPAQKEKKAANTQVVSGCLDEKSDYYVIRTDDTMKELAALEPVGFDKALFARFVGHRVSITGELVDTQPRPTLKVKSYAAIKDVSETCVPPGGK